MSEKVKDPSEDLDGTNDGGEAEIVASKHEEVMQGLATARHIIGWATEPPIRMNHCALAMKLFWEAAEAQPLTPEILNDIILLHLKLAIGKCPLEVEEQIKEYVRGDEEVWRSVQSSVIETMEERFKLKNAVFKGEIRLLEILIETSDSTIHAPIVFLSMIYQKIGHLDEAYAVLHEGAKKNPEMALYYLQFCDAHRKFKELIDFYEEYSPELDALGRGYVAATYQHIATWRDEGDPHGTQPEDYYAIQMAQELCAKTANELEAEYAEGGPAGIKFLDYVLRYAGLLLDEAQLMSRDKNIKDVEEINSAIGKATSIIMGIIKKIKEGELDRDMAGIKVLVTAQMHMAKSTLIGDASLEDLKLWLLVLYDTWKDQEMVKELEYESLMLNYIAGLSTRIAEVEGKNTKVENALWGSFVHDWEDPICTEAIRSHYRNTGNMKGLQAAIRITRMAPILSNLIMVDMHGAEPDKEKLAITISCVDESGEQEIIEGSVGIDEHFRPIREALEPYMERFMGKLREILPENAELKNPGMKLSHSILIKCLKAEEPLDNIAKTTDMARFRIITDTFAETHEVYAKVKAMMKTDPAPREWITLEGNPKSRPVPSGYRSMAITGYTDEDDSFQVEVQVRPRFAENGMKLSMASHQNYKAESGKTLKERVDAAPIEYLKALRTIQTNLTMGYRFAMKAMKERDLTLDEILEIYRNPPITIN